MTSVARRQDHDDSGEYSDASQENDQNISENEGAAPESDYDSRGSESDLSDQDPNSQEPERKVDDDEDRSNPQYIPKKGTFYEHDDRTAASGEESANTTTESTAEKKEPSVDAPPERRRPPRKSEVIDKWFHDKYNENEQMPKSRDELVAIYGYDIRNEDAPPHARRNRRYGRGPNKYTRTWEDEEAYKRQANAATPRKPPNPEDFPELDTSGKKMSKRRPPRPRSKSQPSSLDRKPNGTSLRRNASIKSPKGNTSLNKSNNNERISLYSKTVQQNKPTAPFSKSVQVNKNSSNEKMPLIENLSITTSTNNNGPAQRKVAPVAQQRPVPTAQGKKPTPHAQTQPIPTNNNTSRSLSPPNVQQQHSAQQTQQHQQQNQQPNVESRGGSKRYSSQRQRPLTETYAPQQHRYHPDYTSAAPTSSAPAPLAAPQINASQLANTQLSNSQLSTSQLATTQLATTQLVTTQLANPQLTNSQLANSQLANSQLATPQLATSQPPQIHPQQQQIMHQVHRPSGVSPQHGPSPPHQSITQLPHTQQVRIGMMEQQQLVSHPHPHPLHNIPPQPHSIGQLQPAQGYGPQAIMPAQYMQPVQSGTTGVYPGGMYAQPPATPYPHQLYQHHNYVHTNPAAQAGGVTYYNPSDQEIASMQRAQRRPTAAIPIVRPSQPDRPVNSAEKENIDRIVENMFVRKPWPATHGTESKEKSQSQDSNSKDQSQPNSMTSSISSDSRPSADRSDSKEPDNRIEGYQPEALAVDVIEKNDIAEITRTAEMNESIEPIQPQVDGQSEVHESIATEA